MARGTCCSTISSDVPASRIVAERRVHLVDDHGGQAERQLVGDEHRRRIGQHSARATACVAHRRRACLLPDACARPAAGTRCTRAAARRRHQPLRPIVETTAASCPRRRARRTPNDLRPRARPRAERIRHAGWSVTSAPEIRTFPDVGAISPDATRATVVLPAPFGPSSAHTPPVGTANETPNSARKSPYEACTSSSSSAGRAGRRSAGVASLMSQPHRGTP